MPLRTPCLLSSLYPRGEPTGAREQPRLLAELTYLSFQLSLEDLGDGLLSPHAEASNEELARSFPAPRGSFEYRLC